LLGIENVQTGEPLAVADAGIVDEDLPPSGLNNPLTFFVALNALFLIRWLMNISNG